MAEETFVLRDMHGRSLNLSDNNGLFVEEHDGLALPPVERVWGRAPGADGAFQTAATWRQRVITLRIANLRDDPGSWTLRQSLIAMLNQRDALLYLDTTIPSGTYRTDVRYMGEYTGRRAAGHDGFDRSVVQFITESPCYYGVDPSVYNWLLFSPGTPGTAIPMAIPTLMGGGGDTIHSFVYFPYAGTYLSRPILQLDGPLTNPVVTNVTTGEKLDFTGATISAGDCYVIDCRTGNKAVTDKSGDNKFPALTTDSDIATFHIAPDPEAEDGINVIQLEASGAGSGTRAAITYWTYYLGI